MTADLEAAARRLRLALDLFRTGEEMMREKLRRQYPDLSAQQIEARLIAWLQERPGAESGDAPGKRVPWPRRGPCPPPRI